MHTILHRINSIALLKKTPLNFGVEIDIRSNGENLILHHDPFEQGELFEEWIEFYHHGTLILNVKEEGLEGPLIRLMNDYQIKDFFFLDQSFPFLRKTAKMGESRCAVRLSEYENIETVLSLTGMVDWVWIDCFTRFPLNKEEANQLNKLGFKLCIVSPELQGRTNRIDVEQFKDDLELKGIKGDAVCTKYADLWS
jgi:hypothetical protein|tara:strand:- start:1457 stop:2044 length:588 start_codon:yes stop_codon:yes gene_type:complete